MNKTRTQMGHYKSNYDKREWGKGEFFPFLGLIFKVLLYSVGL